MEHIVIAHSELKPGHIAKISYFQAMCRTCKKVVEIYEPTFREVEKTLHNSGWRHTESRGWFCRSCVSKAIGEG